MSDIYPHLWRTGRGLPKVLLPWDLPRSVTWRLVKVLRLRVLSSQPSEQQHSWLGLGLGLGFHSHSKNTKIADPSTTAIEPLIVKRRRLNRIRGEAKKWKSKQKKCSASGRRAVKFMQFFRIYLWPRGLRSFATSKKYIETWQSWKIHE